MKLSKVVNFPEDMSLFGSIPCLHVPSGFDGSPGSGSEWVLHLLLGCVGSGHLGGDGVRGARAGARLGLMVIAALCEWERDLRY